MSLQVWLPLNGDLHNQGLYELPNTSQNTAAYNTSGKIGSCMTGSIAWHLSNEILGNEWSVALWMKPTSAFGANNNILFCKNASGSNDGQIYFSIINGTSLHLGVNGATSTVSQSYTFETNKWYHLVGTFDGLTAKLYINGVFQKSGTTSAAYLTGKLNMRINGRSINAANTSSTGSLSGYNFNDFRLYNHALSDKEIKEIAKGLVLHYKLDSVGLRNGNENLLVNSRSLYVNKLNIADGSRREYEAFNVGQSYMDITTSTQVTVSFDCTLKVGSVPITMTIYNTNNKGPVQLSTCNANTQWAALNPNVGDIITTRIAVTTTLVPRTGSNTDNNYIEVYTVYGSNNYYEISNMKVELGNQATPYTPSNVELGDFALNTVYDVSGYGNNGTIVGTLSVNNNTSHYSKSILFNGTDACIRVPYKECNPDGIFTLNLWFYKDALGSKNYETLFGGPSGFEMDTRSGASTTLSLYMASTRGGNAFSPFSLSTWYMVTMVRDGTNEMYYINGELKKTIEAKSMPNGIYRIGAWASDTGQNYYGNISDFRIYATALSDEDILDLYHTPFSIDNKGNGYAREIIEDANLNITKTGQFHSNEMLDNNDYTTASITKDDKQLKVNTLYEY